MKTIKVYEIYNALYVSQKEAKAKEDGKEVIREKYALVDFQEPVYDAYNTWSFDSLEELEDFKEEYNKDI